MEAARADLIEKKSADHVKDFQKIFGRVSLDSCVPVVRDTGNVAIITRQNWQWLVTDKDSDPPLFPPGGGRAGGTATTGVVHVIRSCAVYSPPSTSPQWGHDLSVLSQNDLIVR